MKEQTELVNELVLKLGDQDNLLLSTKSSLDKYQMEVQELRESYDLLSRTSKRDREKIVSLRNACDKRGNKINTLKASNKKMKKQNNQLKKTIQDGGYFCQELLTHDYKKVVKKNLFKVLVHLLITIQILLKGKSLI